MKQHDKGNGHAPKPTKASQIASASEKASPTTSKPTKQPVEQGQGNAGRRKTSKYFATSTSESSEQQKPDERKPEKTQANRKTSKSDDDDDFVPSSDRNELAEVSPVEKLRRGSRKGTSQKSVQADEEDDIDEAVKTPPKGSCGGGGGGRGTGTGPSGGRGRGGGRGGFMDLEERKEPPKKGQKEVPEEPPDCLQGLTFVISGILDGLEREEAEDLIPEENGESLADGEEEENSSDAEDDDAVVIGDKKPQLDFQSDKSTGIQVLLNLKNAGNSTSKKTPTATKPRGSGLVE